MVTYSLKNMVMTLGMQKFPLPVLRTSFKNSDLSCINSLVSLYLYWLSRVVLSQPRPGSSLTSKSVRLEHVQGGKCRGPALGLGPPEPLLQLNGEWIPQTIP